MPIHAYMQMPTGVANITTCVTQVTLKLVNYALLVNKLWFGLACLELLGNFPTDKHGLDCCLQLDTKVFQLGLNNVSQVLVLEGYDYPGHVFHHLCRRLRGLLVSDP